MLLHYYHNDGSILTTCLALGALFKLERIITRKKSTNNYGCKTKNNKVYKND